MSRFFLAFASASFSLAALSAVSSVASAADSVKLHGLDGQVASVTVQDLATMPHREVKLSHDGQAHRFSGVALNLVLEKIGAPAGKVLHGKELGDVVLLTARDGYHVALALAETDPTMHDNAIILADHVDGAPISPHDGPFRLIVGGDLHPARSERMVEDIALIRLGEPPRLNRTELTHR